MLSADAQREFWYRAFHQLELAVALVDGHPAAVRAYLQHFWTHWSGPGFHLRDAALDHLTDVYAPAGAFTASIGWYRASAGGVAGVGHFSPLEAPAEFAAAIARRLEAGAA